MQIIDSVHGASQVEVDRLVAEFIAQNAGTVELRRRWSNGEVFADLGTPD